MWLPCSTFSFKVRRSILSLKLILSKYIFIRPTRRNQKPNFHQTQNDFHQHNLSVNNFSITKSIYKDKNNNKFKISKSYASSELY